MTSIASALDPTRLAGTLAFGTAALGCLYVAASARSQRTSVWWILGAVQLVCLLEVLLGLRYGLHNAFGRLLKDRGWYASRDQWQAELLVGAVVLVAAAAACACWRHRHDGAAMLAIVGTALGVSVLGAETVSPHRLDAIMYTPAGPWVVLAWMWLAASAVVTVAALKARR